MKRIRIAKEADIDDIVELRVAMQIEDWTFTLNQDFSVYSELFYEITKNHVKEHLNQSLFFALMYLEGKPIAMCGLEELGELPQITACTGDNGRHGCIVSVYTKPAYRGKGYQQEVIGCLLDFAKRARFHEITLTTNTPDAMHIYEKFGFRKVSDKYYLEV